MGAELEPACRNLLYHHVRMAKEIQLHMWISFLEGVVSSVRRAYDRGDRHRYPPRRGRLFGVKLTPEIQRRLAELRPAAAELRSAELDLSAPPSGCRSMIASSRCPPRRPGRRSPRAARRSPGG